MILSGCGRNKSTYAFLYGKNRPIAYMGLLQETGQFHITERNCSVFMAEESVFLLLGGIIGHKKVDTSSIIGKCSREDR